MKKNPILSCIKKALKVKYNFISGYTKYLGILETANVYECGMNSSIEA